MTCFGCRAQTANRLRLRTHLKQVTLRLRQERGVLRPNRVDFALFSTAHAG